MIRRSRSHRGVGVSAGLVLAAALLLMALGGTAFGAPPQSMSLPTISPSTPHVTSPATASTGTWKSEAAAHWFEGESTQLKEGEKVNVTAQGSSISIGATLSGIKGSVACETSVTAASLENPSGGAAGVGNATIEYKNCKAEGGWAACKAGFGAPASVKLQLSTTEGKPKIALSPTGADLGTLTLSGCLDKSLEGSHKLLGVINGFYSNAGSLIEFNAETSGTGALRFKSTEGPKATATGSIGLKTSEAVNITAGSLTYGYAWKRCSGGCEVISGATGNTYVPVAADHGKNLRVTVTATDSSGSTIAESSYSGAVTASLSWYANTGASWQRLTSPTSFTASNVLSGEEPKTVITWTWSGVPFEISCTGSSGSGTLSSSETQAKVDSYSLTLTGCTVPKPSTCGIEGSKLTFKTLSATSPTESASKLKPELKFVPHAGGVLAEFTFTGCGLGHYSFTGYFPALVDNAGSNLTTTVAEVGASKGMRFEGITGPVVSMTSTNRILSEGVNPLKLDIEP